MTGTKFAACAKTPFYLVRPLRRPRRVDTLYRARQRVVCVSAAYEHAGACCADGSVWMWGLGEHGQLGLGNTATQDTPVMVQSLVTAQV